MAKREARAKETGKRPGGKPPKRPEAGVRPNDQINLTDEESRIMPGGGHGFQQAYNVQAGVDTETLLVVTETVTPHANDKQEIEPALKALEELAEPLGQAGALLFPHPAITLRNSLEICECRRVSGAPPGGHGTAAFPM